LPNENGQAMRPPYNHASVKLLSFCNLDAVLNRSPSSFRRLQNHFVSAADARSSLNRRICIGITRAAINSPLPASSSTKYISAKSPAACRQLSVASGRWCKIDVYFFTRFSRMFDP
jgi:hypothetical protein